MVTFYCMCQIEHRDERTQPVNMLDGLSWIPESPHNGGRELTTNCPLTFALMWHTHTHSQMNEKI